MCALQPWVRDEILSEEMFYSLKEALINIERLRSQYRMNYPDSRVGIEA